MSNRGTLLDMVWDGIPFLDAEYDSDLQNFSVLGLGIYNKFSAVGLSIHVISPDLVRFSRF